MIPLVCYAIKIMPKIDSYNFLELVNLEDSLSEGIEELPKELVHYVREKPYGHHLHTLTEYGMLLYQGSQIGSWYESNTSYGLDSCTKVHLTSKEELKKLLGMIRKVLAETMSMGLEEATKHCKPGERYFYLLHGATDKEYINTLLLAKSQLEELLETADFHNNFIYYADENEC